MITVAVRSLLSCRVGRSRRLSWPWSASIRLLPNCSKWCHAARNRSSSSLGYTGARSVITSAGAAPAPVIARWKERPRGGGISFGGHIHVDDLPVLVDRAVHIAPPAAHLDTC